MPPGSVEDGVLQAPDQVGQAITKLFKNLKLSKNTKVAMSISGYSVIVKKVKLDVMEDEQLEKYLKNEAEQYIPFDIADVYLDFQDLKTNREEYDQTDIMLVAAKKEVIDGYLNMLRSIKLQPLLVDVDGFALENIWSTVDKQNENIALIDIGAEKMNINIIIKGTSVVGPCPDMACPSDASTKLRFRQPPAGKKSLSASGSRHTTSHCCEIAQ